MSVHKPYIYTEYKSLINSYETKLHIQNVVYCSNEEDSSMNLISVYLYNNVLLKFYECMSDYYKKTIPHIETLKFGHSTVIDTEQYDVKGACLFLNIWNEYLVLCKQLVCILTPLKISIYSPMQWLIEQFRNNVYLPYQSSIQLVRNAVRYLYHRPPTKGIDYPSIRICVTYMIGTSGDMDTHYISLFHNTLAQLFENHVGNIYDGCLLYSTLCKEEEETVKMQCLPMSINTAMLDELGSFIRESANKYLNDDLKSHVYLNFINIDRFTTEFKQIQFIGQQLHAANLEDYFIKNIFEVLSNIIQIECIPTNTRDKLEFVVNLVKISEYCHHLFNTFHTHGLINGLITRYKSFITKISDKVEYFVLFIDHLMLQAPINPSCLSRILKRIVSILKQVPSSDLFKKHMLENFKLRHVYKHNSLQLTNEFICVEELSSYLPPDYLTIMKQMIIDTVKSTSISVNYQCKNDIHSGTSGTMLNSFVCHFNEYLWSYPIISNLIFPTDVSMHIQKIKEEFNACYLFKNIRLQTILSMAESQIILPLSDRSKCIYISLYTPLAMVPLVELISHSQGLSISAAIHQLGDIAIDHFILLLAPLIQTYKDLPALVTYDQTGSNDASLQLNSELYIIGTNYPLFYQFKAADLQRCNRLVRSSSEHMHLIQEIRAKMKCQNNEVITIDIQRTPESLLNFNIEAKLPTTCFSDSVKCHIIKILKNYERLDKDRLYHCVMDIIQCPSSMNKELIAIFNKTCLQLIELGYIHLDMNANQYVYQA